MVDASVCVGGVDTRLRLCGKIHSPGKTESLASTAPTEAIPFGCRGDPLDNGGSGTLYTREYQYQTQSASQ